MKLIFDNRTTETGLATGLSTINHSWTDFTSRKHNFGKEKVKKK